MMLNEQLNALLSPLVSGGAWADSPAEGVGFPHLIYQQVGGQATNYLDGGRPSHRHARIQVVVWADRRTDADRIAYQVENTLRAEPIYAQVIGALTGLYEPSLNKYGTRQDFSLWYADPIPTEGK